MTDKNLIKKICSLYLEEQHSMIVIAEKLDISPSKVVYWLEKNNISRRNRSEAGYLNHEQRFNKLSCNIKKKLSPKEEKLLITGLMLYWAEGSKKNNGHIAFSNSDPKMIQLFLKFLREVCGVYENRLKILLHLYKNQNELKLKKFWSKNTGIPLTQFNTSCVHKGKTGTYKKKSRYGTISLRYCDKKLLEQILKRIDSYADKLLEPSLLSNKNLSSLSHLSSVGRAIAL